MKKLQLSFGVVGLLLVSVSLSGINLHAQSSTIDRPLKIDSNATTRKNLDLVDKISKADSQKALKTNWAVKDLKNEKVSHKSSNLRLDVELKTRKLNIENQKGKITIGVPKLANSDTVTVTDNSIIYSGENSKTDIVVENVDGGVRQILNIKSKDSAAKYYDFPMELSKGDKIIINSDGSGYIEGLNPKTKKTTLKMTIGKPWAKDNTGKDLKTYYTVENGNTLRQHIDYSDAVFPVIADPTWCGNQINIAEWVDRPTEGGLTLSIEPTWCGRNFDGENSYREAISRAPYHSQFPWSDRDSNNQTYKYKVMRQQFLCHFQFATFKSRWNIEPWRPLVEWRKLITYNAPYICNVRWDQV